MKKQSHYLSDISGISSIKVEYSLTSRRRSGRLKKGSSLSVRGAADVSVASGEYGTISSACPASWLPGMTRLAA
ncbi:hypothetical protein RJ639_028097 [Escallonia herrerae]|uniref:Uncharacterized protein n=1 Tax=Escallonia herrerae TaxID=1293975 RepID=A0AA88XIL7_9ASTE|nr:hypothetical protein RJ639_028097 [Escallonia herrerae]